MRRSQPSKNEGRMRDFKERIKGLQRCQGERDGLALDQELTRDQYV